MTTRTNRFYAKRFARTCGVLEGQGAHSGHMVAYDRGHIYDPDGYEYAGSSPIFAASSLLRLAHGRHSSSERVIVSQYNSELISQMTPPLSTEGNLALAPKVAAGDLEARRQMIEGNMPLVVSKVSAYIRDFPEYGYLRDDLTSVGFMGLVAAVNLMAEKGAALRHPSSTSAWQLPPAWDNSPRRNP